MKPPEPAEPPSPSHPPSHPPSQPPSHPHPHPHPHSHSHSHSHPHPHPHPPAHTPHDAPARPPLARGAGVGKIVFFDAFSGVAGDMVVAALVDLGVPFTWLRDVIATLGLPDVELSLRPVHRGAIGASKFDVQLAAGSPERNYREIDALLGGAAIDAEISALARRILRRLAEAESEVHRIPIEDVHFHEVGAADAIVDIVGAAAGLCYLGAEVWASPLPLGRGTVLSRHGVLPLPAPATVSCLTGVPTVDAGVDEELVTPTGAAIVATVAARFERWPGFVPERIGWGAGTKELADRPNVLRVVLGSRSEPVVTDAATHVALETNVDDMTGELAAHVIQKLLACGALDAWATPVIMKKGRPGLTLSVLGRAPDAERLAELLLDETTTLGVRRIPLTRFERPRRTVEVRTKFGVVPVKVSAGKFGLASAKPEFDVCAKLALEHGVTVREVLDAALQTAWKKLDRGED